MYVEMHCELRRVAVALGGATIAWSLAHGSPMARAHAAHCHACARCIGLCHVPHHNLTFPASLSPRPFPLHHDYPGTGVCGDKDKCECANAGVSARPHSPPQHTSTQRTRMRASRRRPLTTAALHSRCSGMHAHPYKSSGLAQAIFVS